MKKVLLLTLTAMFCLTTVSAQKTVVSKRKPTVKTISTQMTDKDSAVKIITEQHEGHVFVGYQILIPIGGRFTWDEGNGKGTKVVDKTSTWRRIAFNAKATVISLNGKVFEQNHVPYIHTSQVKEVRFTRKYNKNPNFVDIITKDVQSL